MRRQHAAGAESAAPVQPGKQHAAGAEASLPEAMRGCALRTAAENGRRK